MPDVGILGFSFARFPATPSACPFWDGCHPGHPAVKRPAERASRLAGPRRCPAPYATQAVAGITNRAPVIRGNGPLPLITDPRASADTAQVDVKTAMQSTASRRQSWLVFFTASASRMTEQRRARPRSRSQTASGHAGRLACGLLHDNGVGIKTVHDGPACSRRVGDYSTGYEQGDDYRVRRGGIV